MLCYMTRIITHKYEVLRNLRLQGLFNAKNESSVGSTEVACVGERREMHTKFCCANPKKREHTEDPGASEGTTLKRDINA